jgi:holin-like protein
MQSKMRSVVAAAEAVSTRAVQEPRCAPFGAEPATTRLSRYLVGAVIILLCLGAGTFVADRMSGEVSGNVIGMVILLVLLRLRIVSAGAVRDASAALLSVLPILFVPLYVAPVSDASFWAQYGPLLLPAVAAGSALIIIIARLVCAGLVKP